MKELDFFKFKVGEQVYFCPNSDFNHQSNGVEVIVGKISTGFIIMKHEGGNQIMLEVEGAGMIDMNYIFKDREEALNACLSILEIPTENPNISEPTEEEIEDAFHKELDGTEPIVTVFESIKWYKKRIGRI